MPSQRDDQSGLYFGYPQGDDTWGPGFNENFARLAYIGPNRKIESITATPPATPIAGYRYIVGANPTGAWGGFAENDIVVWGYTAPGYSTLQWVNFTPQTGWRVYNDATKKSLEFNGTAWVELSGGSTSITTDDTLTENPLSVARPIPAGGTAGQVLKRTATGYEWGAASGTGLTAGEVGGVITAQVGTRLSALVECYLQQNAEYKQFAYTPYNFTTNNSQTMRDVDFLNRGGCSVLLVQGYDPIILEDDDLLALPAGSSGSALSAAQSILYTLARNGTPTSNQIRIGRLTGTAQATPLISKSADSSSFSISASLATLTGMNDISQIKRIIESAVDDNRIDQQALQGVLHTELFSGTAPDAATYATAKGGSVLLRASDGKMFFKGAAVSSTVTNRDQVQFTTGGNEKYTIGSSGVDTRSYQHLFGAFHRESVSTRTMFRYVLLVRQDSLPTGFPQSTFQFRFQSGSTVSTTTFLTYNRDRTRDQVIAGHQYIAYQTDAAATGTRPGLNASQLYTGQFRGSGGGNPPINVWPATATLPGTWAEVPVGSGMSQPIVAQTIAIRNQQTTLQTVALQSSVASVLFTVTPSATQTALRATGKYTFEHWVNLQVTKSAVGATSNVKLQLVPVSGGGTIFESPNIPVNTGLHTVEQFRVDSALLRNPYRVALVSTAAVTVQVSYDSVCFVRPVTEISTDASLKGGTGTTALGVASALLEQIHQAFDLVRLVDDEFTFTVASDGEPDPKIGFRDSVTGMSAFGSVAGGSNPEFTVAGNTWQIGSIWLDGNDLEIRVFGDPATVATLPNLPSTIDFKLKDTTFRGRDGNPQALTRAEAGGRNAYIQYLWSISPSLFAVGEMVTGQVLLAGADTTRLLPTGGVNDQILKIINGVPAWGTGGGGGGGGSYTDEMARDAIATALVAGEPQSDINTTHRDNTDAIELDIKDGVIDLANIRKNATDTSKVADLASWKIALDIPASGGVTPPPSPPTLPALFATRLSSDPANVFTVHDIRGLLTETFHVGSKFNIFKGGTAESQTAYTGNPYTVAALLSGGVDNASQKVRLDKNLGFTSSARPTNITTFSTDVYYLTVHERVAVPSFDFHAYDSARSFALVANNQMARGGAYNPTQRIVSVLDSATAQGHYGYNPTSGAVIAKYNLALTGSDYKDCGWDTTGRYLYILFDTSFIVYDFGADQSGALLAPTIVASRQFVIHQNPPLFQRISGIALTTTEVWILGKHNATTNIWAIDRFSLTGTRNTVNSDILVRGINDATGLHVDTGGTQAWVGSFAGDYVAGLLPSTETGQRRRLSYDVRMSTTLGITTGDIEVKDRILYGCNGNNYIDRRSLVTGATLPNWNGPSGKIFWSVAKAGKFLYAKARTELYRIDTTQATPTFVRVSGTMPSDTLPMTIVNNRLYVPSDISGIQYLTLTGSESVGYTAVSSTYTIQSIGTGHGLTGTVSGIASFGTAIYQSTNSASGTQSIVYGWDYTSGSGDFVGQASDISTGTVNARVAVDTDSTLYVFDTSIPSTRQNIYGFYHRGAQTANIMDIDRTHSFPLGSRQASTYGFGYDQTNDRFFVPNVTRVNTYDKAVSQALRGYQRFDLMGLPRAGDIGPNAFLVLSLIHI